MVKRVGGRSGVEIPKPRWGCPQMDIVDSIIEELLINAVTEEIRDFGVEVDESRTRRIILHSLGSCCPSLSCHETGEGCTRSFRQNEGATV